MGSSGYRRTFRKMEEACPALPGEIEGAVAEGIELQTLKAPASIDVDENHHVKGIYVTPQMVSSIRDGRASIKPTGEEDIYIPCDVLIVAIGQNIETHHFEQAGIPVERGKIITKSTGAFENLPGVFAGGDCASIYLDAGFESQRTFNRVFKDRFRMTPREYRKRFRE